MRAPASSPLRSGGDWRVELAIAGFDATGAAPVTGGPWPNSVFWGRAPSDLQLADSLADQPAAGGAAPLPIALIASRSCRELRPARAARARRAPGQRDRSGRVRRTAPLRRATASNDTAAVGEIAVLVAEEGDDPTEQAARLIAHVAVAGGGRCAQSRSRFGLSRPARSRRRRAISPMAGRRCRSVSSGPLSGASRGCCSTRPRVCRCGLSISRRRWTGPSAARARPGAGGGNAGNRNRLDPVGPPCAAAAPRAAAALGDSGRGAGARRRTAGRHRLRCTGGRPSRDRRDRARFRSRCMPPGSISAT